MPTVSPACRASAHTRRPCTSAADCSQKNGRAKSWWNQPLATTPWRDGGNAVRSVACAGHVSASAPGAMGRNWSRVAGLCNSTRFQPKPAAKITNVREGAALMGCHPK